MRVCLFSIFLLCLSMNVFGMDSCNSKGVKLKAYAEEVKRVEGKVVRKLMLIPVPPDWSIHMGTYEELFIDYKDLKKPSMKFEVIGEEKVKPTLVKFKSKNQGFVSKKFKLKEIFGNYIAYAPGKAKAILKNNGNDYCEFSFLLEVGD